jgi:hypothetical protein
MVCGLKISPKFSKQFTLPTWVPLDPQANRMLIEEFLRAPNESFSKQGADASWAEKQIKLNAAFAKKRITFAQAQLDLYSFGKTQTAYRLNYGNCQADNPQLKDPARWGEAIHYPGIKIQYAPDIIRPLFREYFSMDDGSFNEVFLYEGKVYDYIMGGTVNPALGVPDDNQMVVNRHEKKIYKGESQTTLVMNNICFFNYQPVQDETK